MAATLLSDVEYIDDFLILISCQIYKQVLYQGIKATVVLFQRQRFRRRGGQQERQRRDQELQRLVHRRREEEEEETLKSLDIDNHLPILMKFFHFRSFHSSPHFFQVSIFGTRPDLICSVRFKKRLNKPV